MHTKEWMTAILHNNVIDINIAHYLALPMNLQLFHFFCYRIPSFSLNLAFWAFSNMQHISPPFSLS